MKLSVSLSPDEVEAVDRYARSSGLTSRSAVIQHAIHLLGDPELEEAYASAWAEWEESAQAADWDATVGDGLPDAPG